jgi:hypothetical protein
MTMAHNKLVRCCWAIGERQKELLDLSAYVVGLSSSELLRRILDHACRPLVLNEVVPAMSGHVRIGGN